MKKSIVYLVVFALFLVFSLKVANAASEKFIRSYINKRVEVTLPLSGRYTITIKDIEEIRLLSYDKSENVCLIRVIFKTGIGVSPLQTEPTGKLIEEYWVSPALILFPK
ncbi:MAG TPA: hypothetical protein PLB52_03465 [Candidatus Moranbacteria bacterium]|nr:hypothetical protein [Candidatus Moranbacteria bacterium]